MVKEHTSVSELLLTKSRSHGRPPTYRFETACFRDQMRVKKVCTFNNGADNRLKFYVPLRCFLTQ